jgi:prepilin-type N-terminal cleavage/methylation domain-containing protein
MSLRQQGFTLIEMIIVVALMVVITSASLVAVVTFNQKQGINDDAKAVLTELRRVSSRATGVAYPVGTCTKLSGYQLTIPSPLGTKDIRITALCTPANIVEERSNVLDNSYFSGSTVTFTIDAGTGRLIPITPASPPVTLTLTSNTNTSVTEQVEVKSFGVFEQL